LGTKNVIILVKKKKFCQIFGYSGLKSIGCSGDVLLALKCEASSEELGQRRLMHIPLVPHVIPCGLKVCITCAPSESDSSPDLQRSEISRSGIH